MNQAASSIPESFDNDLAKRIFPMRFRRIGNPYGFLNEVGIVPILEYIYRGHLLLDVAEVLNVSLTVLNNWVEQEGHGAAIEEAEQVSAEGYLAEATRKLREATTTFELTKAREMVKQAQFMASKKHKSRYGNVDNLPLGNGVSYVFNIGGAIEAPALKEVVGRVLEHEAPLALVGLDLRHLLAIDDSEPFDTNTPIGAMNFEAKSIEAEPQIGPFFDAEDSADGR